MFKKRNKPLGGCFFTLVRHYFLGPGGIFFSFWFSFPFETVFTLFLLCWYDEVMGNTLVRPPGQNAKKALF